MTNEEASVFLSDMESCIESKTVLNHVRKEALKIAIEALEKQIPKKAADGKSCPNCGKDMWMEEYKFCPDCGQRIDWMDDET